MRSTLVIFLLASCSVSGPPLVVPAYRADDPVVNQGGFVNQVRLAEVKDEATSYILMAWAVGDTMTLGAMVQGPFAGDAIWRVGSYGFRVSFDTEQDPQVLDLSAPPGNVDLVAQTAGFRGFRWVNVEVDRAGWFPDGEADLALEFCPTGGQPIVLPDAGWAYAAHLVEKSP